MAPRMSWSKRLTYKLGLMYRGRARKKTRASQDWVLRQARRLMQSKRYALLCTQGSSGEINARVVQPWHPDESFNVWMGTSPATRKVAELTANPEASLVYQRDKNPGCVVLKGTTELVEAREVRQRRFMPMWSAFFPEGPDEDFVVIRFEPTVLEMIDFKYRITPEPFGLRPVKLIRDGDAWSIAE